MTTPNVLDRKVNVVEMSIRNNPNVSKYRIRGHRTLDGAFVGSVEMLEVQAGIHTRSQGLVQSGRNKTYGETVRGYTRIGIDPDEFTSVSPVLPSDSEFLFLRVEDFDIAAQAYLPPGQILVIPPASYFGVQDSTITLHGTSPGISAVAGEVPPPGSMSIALPLYSTSGNITNLDGTDALLVSFGKGMPMTPVASGDDLPITDGSVVEVFVASTTGNPLEFSATFSLTKV